MMNEKTLWFRAGVAIPLSELEYAVVRKGGTDGANTAAYNAAKQLLLSKFRRANFRLTGETYTPEFPNDPKTQWPQDEELSFDFDDPMISLVPERIGVKVICDSGNGSYALTDSKLPSKVGLPEKTMVDEGYDYDEELDHPFFEIDLDGFETTDEAPTVDITPEELVAAFERRSGIEHWAEMDNLPDTKPISVTTIHFTSVEEGASSTQFDTQDTCELMELLYNLLRESHLTLKSVDEIEISEEAM